MKISEKHKRLLDEFEKAMRAALAEHSTSETLALGDEPKTKYFPLTYDVSSRTFSKTEEKTKAELVN